MTMLFYYIYCDIILVRKVGGIMLIDNYILLYDGSLLAEYECLENFSLDNLSMFFTPNSLFPISLAHNFKKIALL